MALSGDRRATLLLMVEKRGQGKVVRIKGSGKAGALVNAANGAQISLKTGLNTMRGALAPVVVQARDVGRVDVAADIESQLAKIDSAAKALHTTLSQFKTPADVRVESDEEPGVPAKDGEGPHGAGVGPRAKGRKARKAKCTRAE